MSGVSPGAALPAGKPAGARFGRHCDLARSSARQSLLSSAFSPDATQMNLPATQTDFGLHCEVEERFTWCLFSVTNLADNVSSAFFYRRRYRVEIFCHRLKRWRKVATRLKSDMIY